MYTYPGGLGRDGLNLVATAGAVTMTLGVLVFVANVVRSRRRGALAGANPWDADTLEWATASPPPSYNFRRLPVVQSRHPLWSQSDGAPVVTGLREDRPEVLVTATLDAVPDHRAVLPGPSLWPLALALATGVAFVGVVFTPAAIPPGAVLTLIALVGWFWPRGEPVARPAERRDPGRDGATVDVAHLPPIALDSRALLWWGQVLMVVIEATVFVILVVTYFYLRQSLPRWPPAGVGTPGLLLPTLTLVVLLASGLPLAAADRAAAEGRRGAVLLGLLAGLGLAMAALALRLVEWRGKTAGRGRRPRRAGPRRARRSPSRARARHDPQALLVVEPSPGDEPRQDGQLDDRGHQVRGVKPPGCFRPPSRRHGCPSDTRARAPRRAPGVARAPGGQLSPGASGLPDGPGGRSLPGHGRGARRRGGRRGGGLAGLAPPPAHPRRWRRPGGPRSLHGADGQCS